MLARLFSFLAHGPCQEFSRGRNLALDEVQGATATDRHTGRDDTEIQRSHDRFRVVLAEATGP